MLHVPLSLILSNVVFITRSVHKHCGRTFYMVRYHMISIKIVSNYQLALQQIPLQISAWYNNNKKETNIEHYMMRAALQM